MDLPRSAFVIVTVVAGLAIFSSAMADQGPGPLVTLNPATPNPVTVTNLPAVQTVTVSNLPAVQTPFQRFAQIGGDVVIIDHVPAGERWIIQHASVKYSCPNGTSVADIALSTSSGGDWMVPQPSPGGGVVIAKSQTLVIANALDQITVFVESVSNPPCQTFAFISGVSVPAH